MRDLVKVFCLYCIWISVSSIPDEKNSKFQRELQPSYVTTITKQYNQDITQFLDTNTFLLSIQTSDIGKYVLIEVVFKDLNISNKAKPILSAVSLDKKASLLNQTLNILYYDKPSTILKEIVDYENYMENSMSHYLVIAPQSQTGGTFSLKWEVQIKLTGESASPLRYTLSVRFFDKKPCPFQCHTDSQRGLCSVGSFSNSNCQCSDGYFGGDCNLEIYKLTSQFWYNKLIEPYSMLYFFYNITDESNDLYIKLDDDDSRSVIYFTFNPNAITSIPNRGGSDVYLYPMTYESVTILIKKQTLDQKKSLGMSQIAIGVENTGKTRVNFKIYIGPNSTRKKNAKLKEQPKPTIYKKKTETTEEPESQIYLFAIVVCIILILLLISLTLLHKYRSHNIQLALINRRQANQAPPLDDDTIERLLPSRAYKELEKYAYEVKGDEGKQYCPICLVEFELEDKCRLTPCYHLFHNECLAGWLKKNENCPFCRKEMKRISLENRLNEPLIPREERTHAHELEHAHHDQNSIPYQPPVLRLPTDRSRQQEELSKIEKREKKSL